MFLQTPGQKSVIANVVERLELLVLKMTVKKNQDPTNGKEREGEEPRLSEVRMRSEEIPQRGAHMLGVVRDGHLHLHPINETHQFRPTLSYLDIVSRKNKRRTGTGSDSDSDDGPPPDPDEPTPVTVVKKEKKPAGETRELQVSARKTDEKGGMSGASGGLSVVRREMLMSIRAEEDEDWKKLEFCDVTTAQSEQAFEGIFSQSGEVLECKTDVTVFLKDIGGF